MTEAETRVAVDTVLDVFCGRHPRGFAALVEMMREDFWFQDPFTEVHGIKPFKAFLRESASHRTNTEWLVQGSAVCGTSAYVRWHYVADYHAGDRLEFDGMTEFGFDDDGRLAFHIDYWDSALAFAGRKPELGAVIAEAKRDLHV